MRTFLTFFLALAFAIVPFQSSALSVDTDSLKRITGEEDAPSGSTNSSEEMDLRIIIDSSGSMAASLEDESKIDVVTNSVTRSVESLRESDLLSVWAYGHSVSSSRKDDSCVDAEELYPYGVLNNEVLEESLQKIQPNGFSPIAYTLEQIQKSVDEFPLKKSIIVLISDGEDACDGDPVAAAEALVTSNPNLELDVIGLAVDGNAREQLKEVAVAGNGSYVEVDSKEEMDQALFGFVKKATGEAVGTGSTEDPILVSGGKDFENARTFDPDNFGKVLSVEDHLKAEESQFFKVTLKPGQGLDISVTTGEKDVQLQEDESFVEIDDAPSASATVFAQNEVPLFDVTIQQERNGTDSGMLWSVSSDNDTYTYFISVGYSLATHKDMTFTVDLLEEYDNATLRSDLPSDLRAKPFEVDPDEYVGYLSGNDKADFYALDLSETQNLTVSLDPAKADTQFALELYDEDRELVQTRKSEIPGDGVDLSYIAPSAGQYLLGVLEGDGKYDLLIGVEGDAPSDDAPVIATPPAPDSSDLIDLDQAQQNTTGETLRTILLISIPIVVVVVVVVVVLLVISRRRKKKSAQLDSSKLSTEDKKSSS